MATSKRQKAVLKALTELGGKATTRQVAEKAGFNVNGIAQTMGVMPELKRLDEGAGGDTQWEFKNPR